MNILIDNDNNDRVLITDFGISKQLVSIIASAGAASSTGVLFWELTSGIPSFNGLTNAAIILKIANGAREKFVDETPLSYSDLFEKCWSTEPEQRPSLKQVLNELEKETSVEFIINRINNGNKNIPAKPNNLANIGSSTSNSTVTKDISNKVPEITIELTDEINQVIDYKEFSEHCKIGEVKFGIVYEAKWKCMGLLVALKCFNELPHETVENIENTYVDLFEEV
ncbi:kinase-like protein [Gigaspora margarita]|uniref:Kinase-like protein n=1 Tax=Gigaspora margarita TaxID=4874 RepID=A0A8H4ATL5_GIGMA|nr:kinase-like protein [Gigaspora margarita]